MKNKLKNIAFIMDGNGRWAKSRFLPRAVGHKEGMKVLRKMIEHCRTLGLDSVTVYAFSTENWKRPAEEVSLLIKLLKQYIKGEKDYLRDNDISVRFIGNKADLSEDLIEVMAYGEDYTKDCKSMIFNIAFNYGGREEITSAVKSIGDDLLAGKITSDDINEDLISSRLYTKYVKDPDLIVRTSGEMRLSNFLLWQSAYSEFYITKTLWPAFTTKELDSAISDFGKRNRRFGGIDEQRDEK